MPVKREIIYPFFLECCEFSDDIFWTNVFEELAYGKAPFGTFINKDFLCCGYKGKEFSYKIERKNPKDLYNEIYELLTTKVGILSYREKKQKKLLFHQIEKNIRNSPDQWSFLKKKNIRDVMYEKYVIDMKNKHNLTNKQAVYLLSLLTVCIIFKSITPKNIIYRENKIQNIEVIDFSNNNIILKKPICEEEAGNNSSFSPVQNYSKNMFQNWNNYLTSLRKIRI